MTDQLQINSLIDLYQSTNGDNWTSNDNWDILFKNSTKLSLSDICNQSLHGIKCITYNSSKIEKIGLANNGLYGTIPSSLCNLITPFSVMMEFHGNNLYGSFPSCILDSLTNITNAAYSATSYFGWNDNQLNGTLSCNNYIITNDSRAQYQEQSTFKLINLNDNQFTGTIPQCLTGPAYFSVALDNNQFTGSVPSRWYSHYFRLSGNKLSGSIPIDLLAVDSIAQSPKRINASENSFVIRMESNKLNPLSFRIAQPIIKFLLIKYSTYN